MVGVVGEIVITFLGSYATSGLASMMYQVKVQCINSTFSGQEPVLSPKAQCTLKQSFVR